MYQMWTEKAPWKSSLQVWAVERGIPRIKKGIDTLPLALIFVFLFSLFHPRQSQKGAMMLKWKQLSRCLNLREGNLCLTRATIILEFVRNSHCSFLPSLLPTAWSHRYCGGMDTEEWGTTGCSMVQIILSQARVMRRQTRWESYLTLQLLNLDYTDVDLIFF